MNAGKENIRLITDCVDECGSELNSLRRKNNVH